MLNTVLPHAWQETVAAPTVPIEPPTPGQLDRIIPRSERCDVAILALRGMHLGTTAPNDAKQLLARRRRDQPASTARGAARCRRVATRASIARSSLFFFEKQPK
jgi:hypothetical protein